MLTYTWGYSVTPDGTLPSTDSTLTALQVCDSPQGGGKASIQSIMYLGQFEHCKHLHELKQHPLLLP